MLSKSLEIGSPRPLAPVAGWIGAATDHVAGDDGRTALLNISPVCSRKLLAIYPVVVRDGMDPLRVGRLEALHHGRFAPQPVGIGVDKRPAQGIHQKGAVAVYEYLVSATVRAKDI